MLTRWHKMFHLLVFGAIVVLAIVVVLLKKDFRAHYAGSPDGPSGTDIPRKISDTDLALQNDLYGGSTPEETFALFLSALQVGDTNLASRYFTPNRQKDWEESLREMKNLGGLGAMSQELSAAASSWEQTNSTDDIRAYTYGTDHLRTITFLKNTFSGKWMITEL